MPTLMVRLGILATLMLSSAVVAFFPNQNDTSPYLRVTFLNIGQGDSILIQTPDGVQALIDGGPDGTVLRELARELPLFDHSLDMVIGTHPDKDHIGGLVDVLDRYTVETILTTENRGETMTVSSYHDALVHEGAHVVYARAGQVYMLGASTTVTVYSPASDPSMLESNTSSIVVKVTYGDIDFMLTGDAPQSIEDYMSVTYGVQLQSEVLKLGHHGSRNSSSDLFLATVNPQYAVVSAGKDNKYGHPHQETLDRVAKVGSIIKSTAELGALHFQTDGKTVWVKE